MGTWLHEGCKLLNIVWPGVAAITEVGKNKVKRITVVHENGSTGPTPWAQVTHSNGIIVLANLAHAATVALAEPADKGE